jgi:hypothetical protein
VLAATLAGEALPEIAAPLRAERFTGVAVGA